jgi:tRNA(Ile)-lysidine synthase
MPGLRAMPAAVLLRPLLDTPPAALEEVCAAAGLAPVRDPSNHNPAFARIRVRRALADSGDVGVAMTALAGATHAFAARRERLEAALLLRLAESVLPLPCGAARIDRTLLGNDAVASALLGRLLRVVGAAEHAPPQSEVARLLKAGSGTLGGAWWRRDGWLLREPALLAPPIPAASGALWDGRFHLAESAPGCLLGALGPGHGVGSTLPAAVRAGLPALWADGRVVMAPHIGVGKPLPGLVFRPVGGPVGSLFSAFPHLGHSPGGNVTYVM